MATATLSNRAVDHETAISFQIARTPSERREAFELVYKSYRVSGLCEPNVFGARVTPYHLLPTTTVFNACLRGEVIATLSLVGDGALGIPMESIYPDEVRYLRDQGQYLGEVSCLADRRSDRRRFFRIFCSLTRLMAQFARHQGLHQLVAAVHPKHARFYERYLGFLPIGGLKSCPHVQNNPAVALSLDFSRVNSEPPSCYQDFFGTPVPADELVESPITSKERGDLVPIVGVSFNASSPLTLDNCVPLAAASAVPAGVC